MNSELITAQGLKRYYRLGESEIRALDDVSLAVRSGEFLCVVGASGSGKSTLLNLLGGLDTPTEGTIQVKGSNLTGMSQHNLASYRAHDVGMVFQSFNLISHRTALGNVELALYFTDVPRRERMRKAGEMLEQMGLGNRMNHQPSDLSGGEQQRVAIARALVKNPTLLLADEPTGNLDRDSSQAITGIIADWNRGGGTVVMVTHNIQLAEQHAHRIMKMEYGKFVPHAGDVSGAPAS